MTLRATISFFRLHLVDTDLGTLPILYNLRGYGRAFNKGFADGRVFLVHNTKDLVKSDFFAGLNPSIYWAISS